MVASRAEGRGPDSTGTGRGHCEGETDGRPDGNQGFRGLFACAQPRNDYCSSTILPSL
jgi:hypothetical protein